MKLYFATFLLFVLQFFGWKQARATHLVGGEVSYECINLPEANFRITFKVYQDCIDGINNILLDDNPLNYAIFINDAEYSFYSAGTIYARDSTIVPPEFDNDCVSNYPSVCMRELIFEVDVLLPPSPFGYTIVNQRCCRNLDIQNINLPGTIGVSYFATIPAFGAGECPNNSPTFNFTPPQIICASNPFFYDFSVTDNDGDSLVYKLCPSYIGASPANSKPSGFSITRPPFEIVPYGFGYTFDNPLPAFPPVYIDPESGMMSFTPNAAGRFQMNVCVDEYRDGVYLNTHSRDLQILITNCSKNVIANTPLYADIPNTFKVECGSYTVQFENTSVGGFAYEWDFGDGSPRSTATAPTHTYADTGIYEFTLIVNPGSTCTDSIKRLVHVYPFFTADFSPEGILCPDETIVFKDTVYSSLSDPYTLTWDFGDGNTASGSNPQHSYPEGGQYVVTLTASSQYGCEVIQSRTLNVRDFNAFAGNDTIVVLGYDFQLNAVGGDQYEWSPTDYLSDPFIPNPQVVFPDTGYYEYVVKVSADEGCEALDTIHILVVTDPSILLPNAFSPNGDGVNDEFKPLIVGYPYVELFRVFNRYGELMHVTYYANKGWDGTHRGVAAEQGVYFYELKVRNLQGETLSLKGDVTLLR